MLESFPSLSLAAGATSLLGTVLPALIALVGVLVTAAVGYLQWRRAQAATRQLEEEKLAHQKEQLAWDQEKLRLSQQLERERAAETARAERARARLDTQQNERDRHRTARRESLADKELADQYRDALAAQLRNMKILDMSRPLDLEKVYVQVTVREEFSQFAREREIRQLAEGDPREHLVRPTTTYRTVVTVRPDEALQRYRRIVVLGDPGSGKTTMLRHLALCAAQDKQTGPKALPVYVELRNFVDSGMEDLVSYVVAILDENYGFEGARPYVDERFAAGDAALLLDGLDEVLGGASAEAAASTYDRIVDEISRLAIRYPNLSIAVTCRRAGWRPTLTSFATLEVVDFTWEQIGQFIDNWFDTQPARGRQLRQALLDNLRMQTLATNPLVLSLIAIVFERELELPERRAELYSRCAEVMLREWDAHRGIRRFSKFTTDRKRDLLQEVAWHFHRTGRRYFPQAELLEVIASYLPTIGIPGTESAAILTEIAAQYGLLKEQAHGWYGFLHLTMQEYFAAVSAAARGADRVDHIVRHRHDPWWEEVLLLLAGLLPDATTLLVGILGPQTRNRQPGQRIAASHDDVFSSDLLLAARCLVGTPRIEDTSLRSDIVCQVKAQVIDGRSRFHRDRAASTLTEIGTEESTAIIRGMIFDLSLSEEARASAARALCRLPDERTERDLDRLLAEGPRRHGTEVIRAVLDGIVATNSPVPAQRLIDLLGDEASSSLRPNIYTAIGSTGNETAIPDLLEALRSKNWKSQDQTGEGGALIGAIVKLNGRDAIPTLTELLFTGNDRLDGKAAEAIASLGESADIARLADLLTDEHPLRVRMAAGRALAHAKANDLIGPALQCLTHPKIDWAGKWLVVVALDASGVPRDEIERLYHDPHADRRVKVALATAMASQGDASVLPVLREAIHKHVVPPDLVMQMSDNSSYALTGKCWEWICQTLRSWGDDSVVPALITLVDQELARYDDAFPLNGLGGAIYAATIFEIDTLFNKLLAHLKHGNLRIRHDPYFTNWLGVTVTSTTAPMLAQWILSAKNNSITRGRRSLLVSSLGRVAKDGETVRLLWRLLVDTRLIEADPTFEAIHAICRRGRFRLFPDGSIDSLPE